MVSCKICKGFGYYEDEKSLIKTCLCSQSSQVMETTNKTTLNQIKIGNSRSNEYSKREKN